MKRIKLTQGRFAIVDDEDFAELDQYKWYFNSGYARKNVSGKNGKVIYMTRFILGITDKDIVIDHINNNTLDNRRENLRPCSQSENVRNVLGRSKIGYKGVRKNGKKYVAQIRCNKKAYTSHGFSTPIEAAKEYDKMAIELHGRFANINGVYYDKKIRRTDTGIIPC